YNERADQLATAARDTLTGSMEANLAVDYEIALRVSAKGQDKPGGWALRLWDAAADSATVHTGREKSTTSNRLSLVAALEGLRLVPEGAAVRVYTSNSYLHDGITTWVQGWIRQHWTKKDGEPVKYSDLWQALVQESGARGVHWVMERGDPPALAEGLDKLASESYAD
ncbi:MAG: hypothetical protein JXQ72_10670, partial [Anaerolineae bacterium]|nr:hypothetical protein [Anaerolineae bacterium]